MNQEIQVKIEYLNERGYGVAHFNSKEVQILDSIPGEEVKAKVYKKKKGILFAEIIEFIKKSKDRLEPKENHFLSCSPWQIIPLNKENEYKKDLIKRLFSENNISLPDFKIISNDKEYGYRNKIEFSFYGHSEDEHVTVAFHMRESGFHKIPADGCFLAPENVNSSLEKLMKYINKKEIRARQLKGVQLRFSYTENKVVIILFLKDIELRSKVEDVKELLDENIKGIVVIHSDMRSPAFVETETFFSFGDTEINEKVLDMNFTYGYNGFFQINPPVFEKAIEEIRNYVKNISNHENLNAADIYAGVGTIGLSLAKDLKHIHCVEITPNTKHYCEINSKQNNISNFEFTEGLAEKEGLEFITENNILILDPPRSGLHPKVVKKIEEIKPKHIIYLSCNPKTQAENLKDIIQYYSVELVEAYNFYPHTPHVEFLCILKRK